MNQVVDHEAMHECVAHYQGAEIKTRRRPCLADAIREIENWHSECRAAVEDARFPKRVALSVQKVIVLEAVLGILSDVLDAEEGR
jgi:hypothetical protein